MPAMAVNTQKSALLVIKVDFFSLPPDDTAEVGGWEGDESGVLLRVVSVEDSIVDDIVWNVISTGTEVTPDVLLGLIAVEEDIVENAVEDKVTIGSVVSEGVAEKYEDQIMC